LQNSSDKVQNVTICYNRISTICLFIHFSLSVLHRSASSCLFLAFTPKPRSLWFTSIALLYNWSWYQPMVATT